jgi:hypothetical protein
LILIFSAKFLAQQQYVLGQMLAVMHNEWQKFMQKDETPFSIIVCWIADDFGAQI